jgi:hypothetical protein
MKTHVDLIPNSNHEIKKKRKTHDMCKKRVQQDLLQLRNKKNKVVTK